MRLFYCIDDAQPCRSQCRACAETVAINSAWERQQIEERERRYDEANPPPDVTGDILHETE
jgi:hypothetical protein